MTILTKKDIHIGNLILVNAKYPIISQNNKKSTEYIPTDVKYPDICMERGAATVLSHILKDMDSDNEIVPVSGYRSVSEQEQIYSASLMDNGKEFTEKYVALPNHSEHQTGFAIDLGLKKEFIDFLRPDFPYEGICNEFRKRALEYGFIERYESGKEVVTGIAHEPWHFRYVGYPHSQIMNEQKLSLEEYIEGIKKFTLDGVHLKVKRNDQNIDIFYVPYCASEQLMIDLPEDKLHQISGNNVDGFIVTLWEKSDEQ